MNMKERLEYIEKIIEIYKNSEVDFFEFSDEQVSLTLEKNVGEVVQRAVPTANVVEAAPKVEERPEVNSKAEVVSPIVGTFYSAPAPDKPDYVKVGDKVKKGQIICIVEAMKLMNEIAAPCDGEIGEILVNNEDGVEYNQVLFRIV